MSSPLVKKTEELLQPILKEKNLELVDVEYVKEGQDWFLRVFIDKNGGIDISECAEVSEQLSESLDKADPVKESYYLEVSSPGVERPLKTEQDFYNHIGHNIYVKLYEPIKGNKEYEGTLADYSDRTIVIEYKIKTRTQQVELPYEKVAKARLAVAL